MFWRAGVVFWYGVLGLWDVGMVWWCWCWCVDVVVCRCGVWVLVWMLVGCGVLLVCWCCGGLVRCVGVVPVTLCVARREGCEALSFFL